MYRPPPMYAFSTEQRFALTAWRLATKNRAAAERRNTADARKLGRNNGVHVINGGLTGPRVVGLKEVARSEPPAGWRYCTSLGYLTPQGGPAGRTARLWLGEHQLPDPRQALVDHGLPRYAPAGTGFAAATVFAHAGVLWAAYPGDPGQECTWTPRTPAEFRAARDAADSGAGWKAAA